MPRKAWKLVLYGLAVAMAFLSCSPSPTAEPVTGSPEPEISETGLPPSAEPSPPPSAGSGRRIVGYFTSWGDTGLKNGYTVEDIPWGKITHINYAFAGVDEKNTLFLLDEANSIKRAYDNLDPDLPYKGQLNLLLVHRRQYPDTKLLISVGGWGESGGFFPMTDTKENIDIFAESCVQFLRDYDFDGIDIDFEFPTSVAGAGNPVDSAAAEPRRGVIYDNFCALMTTLRARLDEAAAEDGKEYLLTMAAPASAWVLSGMGIGEYAHTLDYVNIMAYDLHGTWNSTVGPHAALYPDSRDPDTRGMTEPTLNADWSVRYFAGILLPDKIVVGMPYYAVGWRNVTPGELPGGLWGKSGGGSFSGASLLWQAFNQLNDESAGFERYYDEITQTPWLWSQEQAVFLTVEDERSMAARAQYVIDNGLGGLMIWQLAGDYAENGTGGYGPGDTLTTLAHDMFTAAEPLETASLPAASETGLTAEFSSVASYPNNQYTFTLYNQTDQDFSNFTLTFTLAGSAQLQTADYAVIESKEKIGLLTKYVITVQTELPSGGRLTLTGRISLPFTGGFREVALDGQAVTVS